MLRSAQGLQELKAPFAPRAHGLDRLKLVKHLDAALRLARLGGLVAEALDEGGEFACLTLVRPCSRVLLGKPLDALGLIEGIVAAVPGEGVVLDRPGGLRGAVEKLPVVADDDHGRAHALEPGLKPDEAVHV